MNTNCLAVNICGVEFENPLFAASGCFGFGLEYEKIGATDSWGAIISKAVTADSRGGNSGRRLHETASGLLNSIGLENPGTDAFINYIWPQMQQRLKSKLIINISGSTADEYCRVVERLACIEAAMLEINISCPNVKAGGMAFGLVPESAGQLVAKLRQLTALPLMVKLSPNAADIAAVGLACQQAGADCLSLVNTYQGLAIDSETGQAVFDNFYAGLSGPAIKPLALRAVYIVSQAVSIPVIGLGGIQSATDVIEFMMAGATAVQIGTANFYQINIAQQIQTDLLAYCRRKQLDYLQQIRGLVRR